MTRIDFYQIEDDESPLAFACRLIDKIYRMGHRIYIHTTDSTQSQQLDDLLWTFRADKFIPHCLKTSDEEAPVRIGHDEEPDDHQDVLINLSGLVPDFFSRFDRVAEVVPLDENSRESARNNYKFYKDRGYPLEYHQMKGKHG